MRELKCPDCGYLNPDIRELGYTLPWTCGKCPHVWRLQDVMPAQAPLPADMKKILAEHLRELYLCDETKMDTFLPARPCAYRDVDQPEGIAWCPGYPEKLPDISPLYDKPALQSVVSEETKRWSAEIKRWSGLLHELALAADSVEGEGPEFERLDAAMRAAMKALGA